MMEPITKYILECLRPHCWHIIDSPWSKQKLKTPSQNLDSSRGSLQNRMMIIKKQKYQYCVIHLQGFIEVQWIIYYIKFRTYHEKRSFKLDIPKEPQCYFIQAKPDIVCKIKQLLAIKSKVFKRHAKKEKPLIRMSIPYVCCVLPPNLSAHSSNFEGGRGGPRDPPCNICASNYL